MSNEKIKENIRCPYCDTVNSVEIRKNGIIFPYPPLDDNRNTIGAMFAEKLFSSLERKGILVRKKDELEINCPHCHNFFVLAVFLKSPTDPIYDEKEQNSLKFLSQTDELETTIPIFERFLSWYFKKEFFPFKNRLFDTYILLILPFLPFLIIQHFQTGSFSILKDVPFIFLFLLIGILIFLYNIFNEQFHTSLNISELPLDISDEYKKSRFGHLFEKRIIKDSIYDFWDIPFSNKKIHHSTAYGIILALGYLFFYWILVFVAQKNLFFGQAESTFLTAISYLGFWLIVCFILGNIVFLIQSSASIIFRIFEKIPVKISLYKKSGGFSSIIDLCNLIIFQISIISLIAITWIIGLVHIHFLTIDFGAFLREPIGIVLLGIIVILMLWLYVMPIVMIFKKYQRAKNDCITEIATKLASYSPSKYDCDTGELQKMQFDFNRANSLPDWPTNIRINLIISMAIPIVSWLINFLTN
jgi:hypothetical protein